MLNFTALIKRCVEPERARMKARKPPGGLEILTSYFSPIGFRFFLPIFICLRDLTLAADC